MRTKLPVLMVLFITTVLMLSMAASAASADRTLPTSVAPSETFTVSMSVADYGLTGVVAETIPAGFSYSSSSLDAAQVSQSGNTVSFVLLGETGFTYSVTAAGAEGTYGFAGVIKDFDKVETAVGGDSSVDVVDDGVVPPVVDGATATRNLPGTVAPVETFNVSVAVADYGLAGQLVETLPAGFTFVGSSHTFSQVGQTITFPLLSDDMVEYTVTAAGAEGLYTFAGTIKDFDKNVSAVGGDKTVSVSNGPVTEASATRTLPTSVEPGETFTVGMTASDYGTIGKIVETIPAGFTFMGSTLDAPQVIPSGNTVTFLLLGDSSFEYTVVAPGTEGVYSFSGTLEDEDKNTVAVTGDTSVSVETPVVPVPDGDIPLSMGWNFFSVPCSLNNSSVASVLEGVSYNALIYYDASSGLWEPVTDIEPLKGYWISVTAEDQCIMESALEPLVPSVPATMQLHVGWNAIGYTDSQSYLSAELTLESIDESYSVIWGPWNTTTMSYDYFGHNGQSGVISGNHVGTDVFEMCPYKGYWVYLTQEDVLNAIGN